jgi:diadenosine tetraphosphatase ApaH/serine/threonine PP2A family protein phosphatase
MAPRTIIIGDVHGCLDELVALVAACGGIADSRVVLVGDLVAKGPDPIGVIRWARENGATAVLGNHDDHVLTAEAQATAGAPDSGGKKPKHAPKAEHLKIAAAMQPDDWAWLRSRPLWLSYSAGEIAPMSVLVVHGGLVPGVALHAQERRHLLALRSIDDDGKPSTRIEGVPWASRWTGPEHVVFGHDALRGLQQHPFATGLDSGCVYGKQLTALLLPERRLISVPAARAYAPL